MYKEQTFSLTGLKGLSDKQIAEHLKLYAGYVKNVNAMEIELARLMEDSEKNMIELSEVKRRLGFEWNGMRLHELYFSALGNDGSGSPDSGLAQAIKTQFGSFEAWAAQFRAMGTMRGIGWVLLVHDTKTGTLHNVWVSDHEVGHLAGEPIILAMDMWEHAFLLDYLPAQKKDYISAFFENLNWGVIEKRFNA